MRRRRSDHVAETSTVKVSCRDLTLRYGPTIAIDGVDLQLSSGETVAITGASGSGKTSLLYCLSGLEEQTSGSVELLGNDLDDLTPDELADLRLHSVGFVFQSADLVPELTLRDNIGLPLELAGVRRGRVRRRVDALVDELGLTECGDRRPHQVSGGQAQRAAVGRAVVAEPAVIFADEPTGAVDTGNRGIVLDMLLEQSRRCSALLVTVTHDLDVAGRHERRIDVSDGRVLFDSAVAPV